jgi:hypothetical protein
MLVDLYDLVQLLGVCSKCVASFAKFEHLCKCLIVHSAFVNLEWTSCDFDVFHDHE